MTCPNIGHFDLPDTFPAHDEILIRANLGCAQVGVNHDGLGSLVIPVANSPTRDRSSAGRLRICVEPLVELTHDGIESNCAAVVLVCTDRLMLQTFCALCVGITGDVERRSLESSSEILSVVDSLSRFFNNGDVLDVRKQVGLWGELQFMIESNDIDSEVAAWQAAARGRLDFVDVNRAREIKTSTAGHQHRLSVNQVSRGDQHTDAVLMSYWVSSDQAGYTLADQVDRVRSRTTLKGDLERGLLRYGYRDVDTDRYEVRMDVIGERMELRWDQIPRVRTWDSHVDDINYEVNLDHLAESVLQD